jgi:hypothetical protein
VLVSLEEAHLYSHSARTGRTEFEEHPDDRGQHDGDVGKQDDETEGTGMLEMNATEYSIAGLRNEVRKGARGKWTDYESKRGSAPSSPHSGPTGLTGISEIQTHQQGDSGYRYGRLQLATFHPMWLRLVRRQVSCHWHSR